MLLSFMAALVFGCDPAEPIGLASTPDTSVESDEGTRDAGSEMDAELVEMDAALDGSMDTEDATPPAQDAMTDFEMEDIDGTADAEVIEPDAQTTENCSPDMPCPEGSTCETIAACPPAVARCVGGFGAPCESACDCGGVLYCDGVSNQCIECLNDANCSPQTCSEDGRCID